MSFCIDQSFMGTKIIHGDTFEVLKTFPDEIFSGIITDPPYASGAADQNSRAKSTAQKYSSAKEGNALPDFEGDSKDQRSWTHWTTEWLIEARRCSLPGAPVCMFIDWRQLPSMTDALQWAGWIYRGILVWDKTNSRPQRGRFRQQAEFIVWGSNGHMPVDRKAPVLPGVFRQAMPTFTKRIHQTEKPLEVMRDIVKIVEPGGIILDPFAGAGTTVLAAALEGHSAVGIELSEHYANAAAARLVGAEFRAEAHEIQIAPARLASGVEKALAEVDAVDMRAICAGEVDAGDTAADDGAEYDETGIA